MACSTPIRPPLIAQGQSPLKVSQKEKAPREVVPQGAKRYTVPDLDDGPAPLVSQAASRELSATTPAPNSQPVGPASDVARLESDIFALFDEAERAECEGEGPAPGQAAGMNSSTDTLPE
jgi:hypothetical protein